MQVPAYFDEEQKACTIAAGQISGLETVRLIRYTHCGEPYNLRLRALMGHGLPSDLYSACHHREPVAAALAYGIDVREDKTVMVRISSKSVLDG